MCLLICHVVGLCDVITSSMSSLVLNAADLLGLGRKNAHWAMVWPGYCDILHLTLSFFKWRGDVSVLLLCKGFSPTAEYCAAPALLEQVFFFFLVLISCGAENLFLTVLQWLHLICLLCCLFFLLLPGNIWRFKGVIWLPGACGHWVMLSSNSVVWVHHCAPSSHTRDTFQCRRNRCFQKRILS